VRAGTERPARVLHPTARIATRPIAEGYLRVGTDRDVRARTAGAAGRYQRRAPGD